MKMYNLFRMHMHFSKYLFCLLFFVILDWNNSLTAQNTNIIVSEDSLLLKDGIPSLDVYINSAMANSPLLKVSDKQISQIFEQIKKEKKSWTDFVFFDANAKYGLYNQVTITDMGTDGSNDFGLSSNREQVNYYVGVSIRMPLSKITNKRNELKIINENLEQKKMEREETLNQLKQLVVEEYYNLSYLSGSLKINQEILQALNITLLKTEKDLKSGIINLETYNSVVVQKGKAEEVYCKIRNEFFAQYKKLQILTGYNNNQAK